MSGINTITGRNWRVLVGDVLDGLRTLPDESVQCCVTSPPYYQLRDYGIDGQIGLESTPAEFISRLVDVFREVRRVLRKDGTCWINLGCSYASGGMNPSLSPLLMRAPSCGTSGIRPQDSQDADLSCRDSCDALPADSQCRHEGIVHNAHSSLQDEQQSERIDRDSERLDSCRVTSTGVLPASLVSTKPESFSLLSDASSPEAMVLRCQSGELTSPHDAPQCERNSVYMSDRVQKSPPLVVRTSGKESFFSACQRPDCKGIGKCGQCWCSLAIPSLDIKTKDEINFPHLVALALQADGWVLRQTICWAKRSPMPESVNDRCTKAHEYIFLLTKSARYFYDADAVKEPQNIIQGSRPFGGAGNGKQNKDRNDYAYGGDSGFRNLRTVWTLSAEPFSEAHFATFPSEIPRRCIKAGTSEKGCCPNCGAPWERVTERKAMVIDRSERTHNKGRTRASGTMVEPPSTKTTGWQPTCECGLPDVVPCAVLDPFSGSGTTGMVATELGRRYVGCELNPEYAEMSRMRIESWKLRDVEKPKEPLHGQKELF